MKKKSLSLMLVLVLCGLVYCQSAFASDPGYVMKWDWFDKNGNKDAKKYDYVLGYIRNYSGKKISNAKLRFTILDKKMVPIGQLTFIMDKYELENDKIKPFVISFDNINKKFDVDVGFIDFIYLEEINYDDGSSFHDPGNIYFLNTIMPEYSEQYDILEKQILDNSEE